MKKSRPLSFIFVFLVYVVAIAVGVVTYNVLNVSSVYLKLLIADVVATVVTFIFSVIVKNASVYDPYWSVQPIVIAVAFAFSTTVNIFNALMLIAVCFWGIRLTANWAYTFHGLEHQDWRYTMLKKNTGKFYPVVNFLGIHLFPTLVVYACVLPIVHSFNNAYTLNVGSCIFFAVSILAVILQFVSDKEMQEYRKTRPTPFIKCGLWKYSRHPNYLGEILMWWGIAGMLFCVNPSAWYLCGGAMINTLMFLFISIPMADKRQAKKQGFKSYKKHTRMLLPIKK